MAACALYFGSAQSAADEFAATVRFWLWAGMAKPMANVTISNIAIRVVISLFLSAAVAARFS